MRAAALLTSIAVCGLLAGCGSAGTADLAQWVKDERKSVKPRIDPLPEVRTHESFIYTAETLSDPFAAFNLKPQGPSAGGPRPNPYRPRDPLEEYPLDALKMVGTLTRANQSWAVIQAPDGGVHRAKIGDHMGQNFGRIKRITESRVDLVELIQNPLGEWIEREANLAIIE
jgi:type IV pilus assembly protein PilP